MTFPDLGAVAWSSYGRSVFLPAASPAMASTFGDAAKEATHNPNFWNMNIELRGPARLRKLWFALPVLGLERSER
jgi:hypothetical protein